MRRKGTDRMRIVHVRSVIPTDDSTAGVERRPHPSHLDSRAGGNDGLAPTKFGMLRLTLGRVRAGSNACEVSMWSDWIRIVNINNGDQEV